EAHAVEAELIGELHLIEILVIELCAFLRVVVAIGECHPGRAILLDCIEVGVTIGHQVEVEDLHAATLMPWMKLCSSETNAAAFSICGTCPHSGTITTFAPGINRCQANA